MHECREMVAAQIGWKIHDSDIAKRRVECLAPSKTKMYKGRLKYFSRGTAKWPPRIRSDTRTTPTGQRSDRHNQAGVYFFSDSSRAGQTVGGYGNCQKEIDEAVAKISE